MRDAEAEQAYLDPDALTLEVSSVEEESREAVIGLTEVGRLLVVVVTERESRIRVVTARRATRSERSYYQSGG